MVKQNCVEQLFECQSVYLPVFSPSWLLLIGLPLAATIVFLLVFVTALHLHKSSHLEHLGVQCLAQEQLNI